MLGHFVVLIIFQPECSDEATIAFMYIFLSLVIFQARFRQRVSCQCTCCEVDPIKDMKALTNTS